MINILDTDDKVLQKVFQNRNKQSETIAETINKSYKKNIKTWKGEDESFAKLPQGASKAKDNRIFMAVESQINKVTARPIKPMVLPANETDDAKIIASNLQDVFLEAYRDRQVKKHVKRSLRKLHFGRLFCLKVFWNDEIDDFDVRSMDPRKVRFGKTATTEKESEFSIELVDDKGILDLIDAVPEEEEKILRLAGITKEQAIEQNKDVEWHEMWIGDGMAIMYRNEVIKKKRNPYYDFDGLLLTPDEMAEINETEETSTGERVPKLNGRRRRQMFAKLKNEQDSRKEEAKDGKGSYEVYLYNHFDKPRKPYIYGTVLEVEDSPIGETTMIEIVDTLQEAVHQGKRQIRDNARLINGITKVDTDIVTMDLADARAMHYDPEGLVYGGGVSSGVTRETGDPLPDMVFKDLADSRNEIDAIFGTNATFRGDSDRKETATGRAILREEGLSRLDEIVDLIDFVGTELYNWWYQMIRVRYTETHLVKAVGKDKAAQTIELMQDDLQEGIEIKIHPGQTLPDDKVFRAERAREDAKDGLIDPVTYLETAGGYDNPEDIVKRMIMFKANPFSIIALDGEDLNKLEEANQLLQMIQGGAASSEGGGQEGDQPDPQKIALIRQRVQQLIESEEFQRLPDEEKQKRIGVLRQQLKKLGASGVEFTRQLA